MKTQHHLGVSNNLVFPTVWFEHQRINLNYTQKYWCIYPWYLFNCNKTSKKLILYFKHYLHYIYFYKIAINSTTRCSWARLKLVRLYRLISLVNNFVINRVIYILDIYLIAIKLVRNWFCTLNIICTIYTFILWWPIFEV
jgi:hypothetical protein